VGKGGDWQYHLLAQDAVWTSLAGVSAKAARLLRPEDRVRFVPSDTFAGKSKLTYKAWDQTAGVAGGTVIVAKAGTAIGTAAETAEPATAVVGRAASGPSNDAPTLGLPQGLSAVVEDNKNPPGDTVTALLGSAFADPNAGALVGVAITGLTGATQGKWQYSTTG